MITRLAMGHKPCNLPRTMLRSHLQHDCRFLLQEVLNIFASFLHLKVCTICRQKLCFLHIVPLRLCGFGPPHTILCRHFHGVSGVLVKKQQALSVESWPGIASQKLPINRIFGKTPRLIVTCLEEGVMISSQSLNVWISLAAPFIGCGARGRGGRGRARPCRGESRVACGGGGGRGGLLWHTATNPLSVGKGTLTADWISRANCSCLFAWVVAWSNIKNTWKINFKLTKPIKER